MHKRSILPGLFLFAATVVVFAQDRITTEEYIETYREAAIRKMEEFGIPASITLAQGILESGSGNSRLARKANNHFGIKCHKDWNGDTFYMDDDARNECFRKYRDPEDSYRDHSLFLTQRDRYAFLFDYEVTDYESWAKGLKKAGYATNPKYPQLLINLIERHALDQYDRGFTGIAGVDDAPGPETGQSPPSTFSGAAFVSGRLPVASSRDGRPVYEINGTRFIVSKEGDTFSSLAEEFEIYSWQIMKYNDLDKGQMLKTDEVIYLEKKRKKADKQFPEHVVNDGETLRIISNTYAVRLSSLRKRNGLSDQQDVMQGMVLKLR